MVRGLIYCNPEISGGKGFSGGTGIAGFPNGESFHIAVTAPTLTLGRLFARYRIYLGDRTADTLTDNVNQVWEKVSPNQSRFYRR